MSNPDKSDAAISVEPLDDHPSGGAALQGSEGSVLVSDLCRRCLLYQEEHVSSELLAGILQRSVVGLFIFSKQKKHQLCLHFSRWLLSTWMECQHHRKRMKFVGPEADVGSAPRTAHLPPYLRHTEHHLCSKT